MKKTFAVSKIENGRVVEVRELLEPLGYPPYPEHVPPIKSFPVAGEDGEVEKLAEEAFPDDFFSTNNTRQIKTFRSYWIAGFHAHAQKYGYSLDDMQAAIEFGNNSVFVTPVDAKIRIEEFINELHPTPTIGQLVECEVLEDGKTVKILK
jgi:hypothetical protein